MDRDTTKANRTVATTPILTNEIFITTTIKTTKPSAENANTTTTTNAPILENPIEAKEGNHDTIDTPINGGNVDFETNKETTSSTNINSNKTQNGFNHPKDGASINQANTARTLSSTSVERQAHDFDKTPSSKETAQHASLPKRMPAASAEREDDREKKKSKSSPLDANSLAPSRNQTQIGGEVQTTSSSNENSKTFETKNSNKPDSSSQTTTTHAPKHNAIPLTTTPYTGMKTLSSPPERQKINCTLRDCSHPLICKIWLPNSNHSSLLSNGSGRLPIEVNTRISFGCDKGFELVGMEYITCTVGGWSHAKPICTPVCEVDFLSKCKSRLKCRYKKPNMNSAVLITESFNEQKIKLHSQLDFYCGAGYLEGAVSRICTDVGWSKPLPNCINYCYVSKLGGCQRPLNCAIYNSYMGVNVPPEENYWNNLFRENSHIAFSCDYGYKLVGENRSTCNFNGWDNVAPKCLRVCDKSLLNACMDPLNCKIFDEKNKLWLPLFGSAAAVDQITADTYFAFNCTEGYQLEGVKQISCTSNGWSHEMPKCVKIPKFCNGSILRECGNGVICKTFDTVMHDFVEIKGGSKEMRMPLNSRVQLSCPHGYKLEGMQSLTCLENGWNNAMPKCVLPCRGKHLPKCDYPLQCFVNYPNELSKFYPLPTDYATYSYQRDTQVGYFCSEGYTLKGAQQTDCTASGWRHETTLDLPKCILGCDPDILLECENPLICHYLRPNQNGWLKITKSYKESMVKVDSYIDFECTKGFRLQGASRISCTSGGWSDDLPKCEYATYNNQGYYYWF
ncbi:PREDICTED: sushi, von Willebrand factor type A, EGF and pentraxin domain-containing protein 1-like [Rhagoletis zephyria]|uniref:sushi, von Willebrand factor type A, EGF and pentraxin domain-containing protein 1-like n=1 Tax=Rhagoletis zephyria TaxID=28612 RepID=UPI00081129C3|nr:PREDICTED: sushi, von Willebrand factor type A, EGF and pentraxin domain-containing protein 1-like [Rhagoletis zephyria]